MPIIDKDGNVYKLADTGMKPIMINDWREYKLHNFNFPEVSKEINNASLQISQEPKEAIKNFVEEHKSLIWCLPLTGNQKVVDKFDGSNYTRQIFGDKFQFEGIV